jgi:uncharacterized protein YndB with AHSA1/START domain
MASKQKAAQGGTRLEQLEVVINRVFDAPRETVFAAWTDRDRAVRWWGPRDFETTDLELDLRPNGHWHGTIQSPEGEVYPQHGVFHEIIRPERLVFTFQWDDGSDPESLIVVDLESRGGQTEMTFRQSGFESEDARDSHEEGWNESFDRLANEVEGG